MPSIAEPRANICYQPILAVFLYFIFIYNLVSYQFFLLSTFSFVTVLLIMFDLFSSQVEPVSHKPLDWDTSWSTTFLVIFTFRTMWVYYTWTTLWYRKKCSKVVLVQNLGEWYAFLLSTMKRTPFFWEPCFGRFLLFCMKEFNIGMIMLVFNLQVVLGSKQPRKCA